MKKYIKSFLLFFCLCALCCGCSLPHRVPTGNSGTIFYELPPDNSIFSDMDMVNLSGYCTYHYDNAKNLVETNYYCPRDTDDGSWGWHERQVCTYDNEHHILTEQRFLPYVDNENPRTQTDYVYFPDGYSKTTISEAGSVKSYYNAKGDLLLHQDSAHYAHAYNYSYAYNAEEGSVEEYLQIDGRSPYLYWKQLDSGKNEKTEIKYHSWGVPEIFWVNTYNDEGERISGNWLQATDLPVNQSGAESMWRELCQPGWRTHYENGNLVETMEQEWDLNIDGIHTEYTLYDYDKNGNKVLELTYNHLYDTRVSFSRFEYDHWGNPVKEYRYKIDFERYREWSLPLSDGGSFSFSYGTDKTIIMKKISAAQEIQSSLYCKNGRFQVQYIGEETILWSDR